MIFLLFDNLSYILITYVMKKKNNICFCRGLLGVSSTLVNIVEDHEFISKDRDS